VTSGNGWQKHELRLWRTKPLALAGNTQLIGNCVENTCKLHTPGVHLLSETAMCSRFSWKKQRNKTKQPVLWLLFESLVLPSSYCVWRSDLILDFTYTTAYCLMFWQQLNFICFSIHNLLCIQTEMWLTVFYKTSLWPQCCHN
jgi:hypothetical protein